MATTKRLRPHLNFARLQPGNLVERALAIHQGVLAKPVIFAKLPVDPEVVRSLAEDLSLANLAAMDGSKTARALRDQKRAALATLLCDLGHYVEMCNVDLPTFLASGFIPIEPRQRTAGPVDKTAILKVDHGNNGQLLVTLKKVYRARHYEIRFADITDGPANAWSSTIAQSAKSAVSINNLTPGRKYWFEARAFGQDAYTDWCESALRICA